jgi:Tfp pilus assembly protein PilN
MAKRPTTTLLIVTSRFVARADFGPGPERTRLGFWQVAAPQESGLRAAVGPALGLGPSCARDVWLLTDQVWMQRVYFAAPVMAGLGGEQLERAIGFEVESFSGIAGLQSRLGVHRLGVAQGSEAFWVTQIESEQAAETVACVAAAGGRLRGLVHPGGLPEPLVSPQKTGPFSRVEVWGRATVCVEKIDGQPAQVRVVNVNPSQPQWRESVESWLARLTAGDTEWFPGGAAGSESHDLAVRHGLRETPALEGEGLVEFLKLWAGELSRLEPRVPLITAPLLPVPVRRLAAVSAFLLAAVFLVCVVQGWRSNRAVDEAKGRLAALVGAQQQSTHLAAQRETVKKQLAKMETVPAGAIERLDEIRRQQERWPAVLSAIAQATGDGVVLDSLTGDSGGAVGVEGVCLRPTSADELAARMSAVLAAKGWTVSAAEKWAAGAETGAGASPLWWYRIVVSPQGAAFAPPATHQTGVRKP